MTLPQTVVPGPGLQVATTLTSEVEQQAFKAGFVRGYKAAVEDHAPGTEVSDADAARAAAGRSPQ